MGLRGVDGAVRSVVGVGRGICRNELLGVAFAPGRTPVADARTVRLRWGRDPTGTLVLWGGALHWVSPRKTTATNSNTRPSLHPTLRASIRAGYVFGILSTPQNNL